jgi:hydroxymethylpyrimidine pyrophosphatase-like HAD family hydrolase
VTARLLISDLDGTLERLHEPIGLDTQDLLAGLAADGVFVAIVTGASGTDVRTRVLARLPRRSWLSVVCYANNGGQCLQRLESGRIRVVFDHALEFSRYRADIGRIVEASCDRLSLGRPVPAHVRDAVAGHVCLDQRETQTTVSLPGLSDFRPVLVAELQHECQTAFGPRISVRPAGSKSIDLHLAESSKASAVRHLLATFPEPARRTVVAGDTLHPGGTDREMLDSRLAGATVISVGGKSIGPTQDFVVVDVPDPTAARAAVRIAFAR